MRTPPRALLILAIVALVGCREAQNPLEPVSLPDDDASASHTFVLKSSIDDRLPEAMNEDITMPLPERSYVDGILNHDHPVDGSLDPSEFWNGLTAELGLKAKLPPPKFSRAYALVHVAIYDALLAAHVHDRKDLIDRTIAAGAASKVLHYLFPADSTRINELTATQVGADRGRAHGRVRRSWALGVRVGLLAVEYGMNDGSGAPFVGPMPTGDGIWTGTNPVLPMCGTWKTWITTSGLEFQPEPPYQFGSHEDSVAVNEVYQISLTRTAEQIAIVHKWADRPPPVIWNGLLNDRITNGGRTLRSARAYAFLNVAMYDAFVSCWATKYTFWTTRPFQRIPGLVTVIPTPNFPSYTSGHSTISAAASVVMGKVFPDERAFFATEAAEAAMSRLYGGIHFRRDNDQGSDVGAKIGKKVVRVMRKGRSLPVLAME